MLSKSVIWCSSKTVTQTIKANLVELLSIRTKGTILYIESFFLGFLNSEVSLVFLKVEKILQEIKLLCNFIEITLRHGCSPVNLLYIFRIPFSKNISGWLFMNKLNIMVTLVVTTAIFCIIFVLYSISYSSLHHQRSYQIFNSVVQSLQELIIKKENETLKFAILHATDPNWMFLYKTLLTEGEKIDTTLRLKA